MKITSAAQHAMFKRAAEDATYAKQRGITQELAREAMEAHRAAGEPNLPERAKAAVRAPQSRRGVIGDMPMFLTSSRD